jgi:hypothetical protein|tara:strand:- start:2239 stop:2388 length:150 start_codon:yes stop_codon:yes gene_type:complete
MNIFKTQVDHSKCLKRTDHWVGTFLFAAVAAAGLLYIDMKEKQSKNKEE